MPQVTPQPPERSARITFGWIAPAFIFGTAAVVAQSSLYELMTYVVLGMLVTGVCGLGLWRDQGRTRRAVWLLCAVFGLGFVNAGVQGALRNAASLPPDMAGIDLQLQGDVVSLPVLAADGRSVGFDFAVSQRRDTAGQWVPWPVHLQLTHYGGRDTVAPAAITAGSRWTWTVRLKPIHALRNPGGRDSRLAPWAEGVTGRGYIRPSPAPRQEASDSHLWLRVRAAAQQVVLQRLAASPRVAGLAAALTVGDQAAIQRDDWTLFRLTGDMTQAAEVAVLSRRADALAMGQWQHVGAANRLVMASHHGSQSANSVEWLDALRPDWVVAQAGYRNRYRHPAAAVQQRWAAGGDGWGMQWVETAWCGAAIWRSIDPAAVTCEREAHPRAWQHMPPAVCASAAALAVTDTGRAGPALQGFACKKQ